MAGLSQLWILSSPAITPSPASGGPVGEKPASPHLSIDPSAAPDPEMGPLVTKQQLDKVCALPVWPMVQSSCSTGATSSRQDYDKRIS